MRKVVFTLLVCLFAASSFGQANGYLGKRFFVDYKFQVFPVFNTFFYSYGASNRIAIGHNVNLGYAVGRKIALQAHFNTSPYTIDHSTLEVSDVTQVFLDSYEKESISYDVKSYGLSISFFINDFISPLGSSVRLSGGVVTYQYAGSSPFQELPLLASDELKVSLLAENQPSVKTKYIGLGFYNSKIIAGPVYWISGIELSMLLNTDSAVEAAEYPDTELHITWADEARYQMKVRQYATFKFGVGVFF